MIYKILVFLLIQYFVNDHEYQNSKFNSFKAGPILRRKEKRRDERAKEVYST